MITPRPLPVVLTAVLLATACGEPLGPEPADARSESAIASAWHTAGHQLHDVRVAVPFQARFYTDLAAPPTSHPACGPGQLLNTQAGAGEATHLGRFTVVITFCFDPSELLDDMQLSEGESMPYDRGVGTLVAANGDELHIAISGAVLPSSNPDYDFEFRDPFTITGGTGRFAGASGSGMTNSLVDFRSQPSRTTHDWQAVMELAPVQ